MADTKSWNLPKLGSPIVVDVPFLQEALTALAKLDPSTIAGSTAGMVRLANISPDTYQFQIYSGTEWVPITKLKGDASTLNGYASSIAANPNQVAVRNQYGQLEGDLTGNANTATTAQTLSETLPVSKGGTGSQTPEEARAALSVPPMSHASSADTYGVAKSTLYGHVKLSDEVDKPSSADAGVAATPKAVKLAYDLANTANTAAGDAQSTADGANTAAVKAQQTADSVSGIANEAKTSADTLRTNLNTTNAEVAKKANKDLSNVPHANADTFGIVKLSDSVSSNLDARNEIAATPKAVKVAYDKAVSASNSITSFKNATKVNPNFAQISKFKLSGSEHNWGPKNFTQAIPEHSHLILYIHVFLTRSHEPCFVNILVNEGVIFEAKNWQSEGYPEISAETAYDFSISVPVSSASTLTVSISHADFSLQGMWIPLY